MPALEAPPSPAPATAKVASAQVAVPTPDPAPAPPAKGKPRGSWIIQVGAFDTKTEAIQRLSTVQDGLKDLLGHANAVTERTEKGDKTMYRARFAGLDRNQAEAACKNLKRSDIPCMLLKD